MPTDTSVLFAYYVCDAISQGGPLSAVEARACQAAYRAVKVAHLSRDERELLRRGPKARARALELGQRRFAAWAARNPDRVAAFRAAAAIGRGLAAE